MGKKQLPEVRYWQLLINDQAHVPNILLKYYASIGLSDADCLHIIQLWAAMPKDKVYLSCSDVQSYLGCLPEVAQALITDFVGRKLLTVCDENSLETVYSFEGLWNELLDLWMYQQACPQPAKTKKVYSRRLGPTDEEIKQVYRMFEAEKNQPLSPTELEKLSKWLIEDGWSGEMLKEALTRAVMHETVSFAYIDKILLRWQKEGISSLAQLETERPRIVKKSKSKKNLKSEIISNQTNYDDIYK